MPHFAPLRSAIAWSLLAVAAVAQGQSARAEETARTRGAETLPDLQLEKLQRPAQGKGQPAGNLFGPRSWEPPAPGPRVAAPPPPPPPPPQAPPLPFVYLGKWSEQGKTLVYLTLRDRGQNFIVRGGETLIGAYQVEAVEETRVILTYLPLNIRQTLPLTAGALPVPGPVSTPVVGQADAEQEEEN